MSELSSLSHEYAANASFAEALNAAVLRLKKAQLYTPETTDVSSETLKDARLHPGKYPELVVRVSGYCAYFDDLPDAAKMELIARTRLEV